MKRLILIIVIAVALTGCKKGISQEEYDEAVINYQEMNEDYATLKKDYATLQQEINSIISYRVYSTNHVAYHIPSTWETKSDGDTTYYYPETGLLMVQQTDIDNSNLTSIEIDALLTSFEEGVSSSSTEYKKIDSQLTYVDLNIVARELSFYSNYNNEQYENKAISFLYDDSLYSFVIAQPTEIKNLDTYKNIIESIITIQ